MQIQKPSDLARIVKTRRQARGLTQQDIADAVGITRQSLARIESGHGGVSFETVLRIFEQLDIRLEAVRSSQFQLNNSARDNDGLQQIASDALTSSRCIDTSALAATVLRSVGTSALTSVALKGVDIPAITAAAAAATRGIDTSALLSSWRNTLNNLTVQVQETGARTGSEIDAKEARKALLSAAIEAGDPDREESTVEEEIHLREISDGTGSG
ncbi:MAG: helix-turn-helix transcriptional regulator [Microbacterium sp.]